MVVIACMFPPPNRGGLNSTHIHGTSVPVEEPSTASKADICGAANRERRCPLPTHTQPNKRRGTAVLPLLERDREQFIQRRLLERRLRTIIPGPISRGNGRFRVHHCLPNCLKASARLKAQGPRTFATTSSERDDGFCKMTPK